MTDRKDFEQWKVDLVYRLQDGICAKCGKPLANGFHRHHEDGNPLNNSVENLTLYCMGCHGGEAGKTLLDKKKAALEDTNTLIKKSLEGQLSGAAVDKILDTIKLSLSLSQQIYGSDIEKPPTSVSMENYLISSGLLMKQYEQGYLAGLTKNIELTEEAKKAIKIMKRE